VALSLGLDGCGGSGDGDSTSGALVRTSPLEVSGGGSAQFRRKGGDNSIQNFGTEAPEGDLRRAATVAHAFFSALAEEDWAVACSRMSSRERTQIARLGAAGSGRRVKGCAPTLKLLIGKVSAADGREATVLDAASLRQDGQRAFLIYRGAQGAPYFIAMVPENGWAVDGLTPVALGSG
jgi:hypothetical protein